MYSTGSSIVTMCLRRVWLMWSMIAASVGVVQDRLGVPGLERVRRGIEPLQLAVDPHQRAAPGLEVEVRAATVDHELESCHEIEHRLEGPSASGARNVTAAGRLR